MSEVDLYISMPHVSYVVNMDNTKTRNGKVMLAVWGHPKDVARFKGIAAEHFKDQAECLRYFVTNFEQFSRIVSPSSRPRTY